MAISSHRARTASWRIRPGAGPGKGLVLSAFGLLIASVPGSMISTAAAADASAWDRGHASQARLIAGLSRGSRASGRHRDPARGWLQDLLASCRGLPALPPEIDWSESANVADITLAFPVPGRFQDASGIFFGYDDAVTFPLHVTPQDPARPVDLQVSLSYGRLQGCLHSRFRNTVTDAGTRSGRRPCATHCAGAGTGSGAGCIRRYRCRPVPA